MPRFLPLYLTCAISLLSPFSLQADAASSQPFSAPLSEIDALSAEIDSLEASLEKLREEALNKEIRSQPLMFDNWDEFAKGIQANEEDEKQILSIKKQLEGLKQKKEFLLEKHPPK